MLNETDWISYKGDPLTPPEAVKGYNKLSEANQKLFTNFLQNFYKVWEFPEEQEHQPIKVKEEGSYLRVDFKKEWLHVTNETTWY